MKSYNYRFKFDNTEYRLFMHEDTCTIERTFCFGEEVEKTVLVVQIRHIFALADALRSIGQRAFSPESQGEGSSG